MTAGGVAPAAPAGLCGGPLGRAGPDLRGTDPKAALSAGPSCSSPPPGAEALSSSDPPHSSACATTGGRRARCTRRTLHAHAPPGTLQATRTRMGDAPSHTHTHRRERSRPHAHAWGGLQATHMGDAPSHTHTHCGGLQATRTCTARDTGLGDAPGRLVHQGAGRGGGRGLGGRAALGGGPSEGPLGAGPPTQRGTPCPARSAADGHWGQCCCWAPGHVTSAATREASVVTAPITQTCQTLTSIYNPQPRPRPRPAGRGNGSQVFACESTSHQPAVSGDLSSRCAALSLLTVCSCPVPRNVCLLLWTEPSCDMAMGGRLHFQRPRSINLLPSL